MTIKITDLLTPAQIEDIALQTFNIADQEHNFGSTWDEEKEFWTKSITEDLDELFPLVLNALSERMSGEQAVELLGRIMYGPSWETGSFRASRTDKVRGLVNRIRDAK